MKCCREAGTVSYWMTGADRLMIFLIPNYGAITTGVWRIQNRIACCRSCCRMYRVHPNDTKLPLSTLVKVLQRASQFQEALDVPAKPPEGVQLYLVAGDAKETDKVAHVDGRGNLTVNQKGPGDATVLRSSALMDERRPDHQAQRLISPIKWEQVFFLFFRSS